MRNYEDARNNFKTALGAYQIRVFRNPIIWGGKGGCIHISFEKFCRPPKQFYRTACGPIFTSLIGLIEIERNIPLQKQNTAVFIVAPCILKIHWVLHTNECTNYILYISKKFVMLKHLKCSFMFRSLDHPQGARIFPCQIYMLKLWICRYIYQWCASISCVCVCVVFSAGRCVDSYTNTRYAATSLINITTYSQF